MLSILAYAGLCFLGAIATTTAWVVLRPMRVRHETNSPATLVVTFVMFLTGPFIYTESLTRLHADELESAVTEAYETDVPILGEMQYFRVIRYDPDRATVFVVGEEMEEWGGTDRCIARLILERDGSQEWRTSEYSVYHSARLGKDSLVLPPYR